MLDSVLVFVISVVIKICFYSMPIHKSNIKFQMSMSSMQQFILLSIFIVISVYYNKLYSFNL